MMLNDLLILREPAATDISSVGLVQCGAMGEVAVPSRGVGLGVRDTSVPPLAAPQPCPAPLQSFQGLLLYRLWKRLQMLLF